MDKRSLNLMGESSWIRSNLQVFSKTGNLNSHDWMQLIHSAGDYLFADLWAHDTRRKEVINKLLDLCSIMTKATSSYDDENTNELDSLKQMCHRVLVDLEVTLPKTDLPIVLHILSHLPDSIYRWNNVRNFWSFFGERTVGYLIRFIHNRDLATENIMTGYTRIRYMTTHVSVSSGDVARLQEEKFANLTTSSLLLREFRNDLLDRSPGSFLVKLDISRRNHRTIHPSDLNSKEPGLLSEVNALLLQWSQRSSELTNIKVNPSPSCMWRRHVSGSFR